MKRLMLWLLLLAGPAGGAQTIKLAPANPSSPGTVGNILSISATTNGLITMAPSGLTVSGTTFTFPGAISVSSCTGCGGGGGSPGGSTTYGQYNNAGAFAGSSTFLFNTSTGVASNIELANAGVFTGTQANLYLQSLINGCSPDAEFEAVQFAHGTEALTGCITGAATTTTHQLTGVVGYATTQNSVYAVGGYFQGRMLANGGPAFGANTVVQDVLGLTSGVVPVSIEADVQVYNGVGTYPAGAGIDIALKNQEANTGTYQFQAVQIDVTNNGGGAAYWASGFDALAGSLCPNACPVINVNAQQNASPGTNYNSPSVLNIYEQYNTSISEGWTLQGVLNSSTSTAPSADALQIGHGIGTAPGGQIHNFELLSGIGLQLDGSSSGLASLTASATGGILQHSSIGQPAANTFGGKCSMSTSTSCTITVAVTYTTPVCVATQQSGTLTGGAVGCTVSGTTVTVTSAVVNSETWGAMVFGDPN